MAERPLVAITTGDPAGVGPEVVLKALQHPGVLEICRPVVLGDIGLMELAAHRLKLPLDLEPIKQIEDMEEHVYHAALLHIPGVDLDHFEPGSISAENGQASLDILERAVALALSGQVDAIATGPINKAALHRAGSPYRGHTRLLADRCGVQQVTMMLLSPGRGSEPHWLRVSHATTHIALKEVPQQLSADGLRNTVLLTLDGLRLLGIQNAVLAVAGLNPHAGDEGLMGEEEIRWIRPLIEQMQAEGLMVTGPLPADTVFLRAAQGEFDAVVALYHDQGHIAVKMHGFENAVNLTLGLPILRTSVDHGTAFDIAWQGQANEASMVAAIELAATMASERQSTTR
ncbi:MAG: 4-hydroxythreonine-4-phosphate dehydrogenase PdxA [Anaerolineales bacterium]